MGRDSSGPWVILVAFCEDVIQNERGGLQVQGIYFRRTLPPPLRGEHLELPRVLPLNLALAFTAGDFRGTCELTVWLVDVETPQELTRQPLHFASPTEIIVQQLEYSMLAQREVSARFEVRLDGHLFSSVPFEVCFSDPDPA